MGVRPYRAATGRIGPRDGRGRRPVANGSKDHIGHAAAHLFDGTVHRLRGGHAQDVRRRAIEPAHHAASEAAKSEGYRLQKIFSQCFLDSDFFDEQRVFEQRCDLLANDGEIGKVARRKWNAGGAVSDENPSQQATLAEKRDNNFGTGLVEDVLQQAARPKIIDVGKMGPADQMGVAHQPSHKEIERLDESEWCVQAPEARPQAVPRLIVQPRKQSHADHAAGGRHALDQLVEQLLRIVEMPRSPPEFIERRKVQLRLVVRRRTRGTRRNELLPGQAEFLVRLMKQDRLAKRPAKTLGRHLERFDRENALVAARKERLGLGHAENHNAAARFRCRVGQHLFRIGMPQIEQPDCGCPLFARPLHAVSRDANVDQTADRPSQLLSQLSIARQQQTRRRGSRRHAIPSFPLVTCSTSVASKGNETRKLVPTPTALITSIWPRCSRTIPCATASPKPVP
jgi:hypothetical protein